MPPLTLSLPQAADVLGVSLSTVKRLVRAGDVPVVEIRRRRVVPRMELERYIERRMERS